MTIDYSSKYKMFYFFYSNLISNLKGSIVNQDKNTDFCSTLRICNVRKLTDHYWSSLYLSAELGMELFPFMHAHVSCQLESLECSIAPIHRRLEPPVRWPPVSFLCWAFPHHISSPYLHPLSSCIPFIYSLLHSHPCVTTHLWTLFPLTTLIRSNQNIANALLLWEDVAFTD